MTTTDDVLSIIKHLAMERDTFTTDDIRPLLPSGIGPRSIPSAVGKARREGIVEEVERVRSTVPERKGSLVPVLRRPGSHLALVQTQSEGAYPPDPGQLSKLADEIVHLKDYLNATGYTCGIEEVATYLLMLASRTWVVLAGPSGTGKSSLVRRVCDVLNGQFHDIQVKPNWVSSEDTLGYFSEVSQLFVPGVVLRALDQAQRNPDVIHFVRFDEMNLASPEYYVAEILSAGETWKTDANGTSVSDSVQLPAAPEDLSLPEVRITNNVFFVGTVNVDETTRTLSPKVLDRSGVLELHHVDFFAVASELKNSQSIDRPLLPHVLGMLSERPRSLSDLGANQEQVEQVAHLLSGLADVAIVLGGPIGYRQRDAILTMFTLAERHELTDILPGDTLLDIGLSGCVIPKWQGSTPAGHTALREALTVLLEGEITDQTSTESLQSMASVSRFPRSCEKLIRMITQFKTFGYFSAW